MYLGWIAHPLSWNKYLVWRNKNSEEEEINDRVNVWRCLEWTMINFNILRLPVGIISEYCDLQSKDCQTLLTCLAGGMKCWARKATTSWLCVHVQCTVHLQGPPKWSSKSIRLWGPLKGTRSNFIPVHVFRNFGVFDLVVLHRILASKLSELEQFEKATCEKMPVLTA